MPHQPYIRERPGSDTAVLCIHGILGTPDHFTPFLPLIPPNWTIHNLLLHGHGGTYADFSASSMAQWKAQVIGEIQSLAQQYPRLIILAHSMGTLLAIDAALAFPRQVSLLFLLAVPLRIALHPAAIRYAWMTLSGRVPEYDVLAQAAQAGCSITLTGSFGGMPDGCPGIGNSFRNLPPSAAGFLASLPRPMPFSPPRMSWYLAAAANY